MTISTLVDLVVGRAQADGAVVVAFFGLARRHFCYSRRPRTQVLFRATEAVQLSGRVVSRRQRLAVVWLIFARFGACFVEPWPAARHKKGSHQFVLLLASVLQPLAFPSSPS